MKIQLTHTYEDLVSIDNLLLAWREFLRGKRNKRDIQEFQLRLMDNILSLHADLSHHTYKHGSYQEFKINDPKPRIIHKASVRDRLLHHAVYRILYSFFDKTFISDSFSCRNGKGTHKAINRFRGFAYIVSKNHTRTCWVLKCDIRKFFHSINQQVLLNILQEYIPDKNIIGLLHEIINNFYYAEKGFGLPLGNLTSQLFANVYMNEFDQFVKHRLKVKHYIRYADDFVVFSEDKGYLQSIALKIGAFLEKELKLQLHKDKIFIKTLSSGVDFLGWVHFPHYRILRNKTKNRMFEKLLHYPKLGSLDSYFLGSEGNKNKKIFIVERATKICFAYLGLISHGNSFKIREKLLSNFYNLR